MDKQHLLIVEQLADQLAHHDPNQLVATRATSTPSNRTRNAEYKQQCTLLDVRRLNRVLAVDTDKCLATVEPQVTMEQLVAQTLPKGLMPRVVPEFRTIKAGGALLGGGIESTSHRYGLFDEGVSSCEVLLGNGETVVASSKTHAALFDALVGSYGTLGLITQMDLQLVEAQPFVELHYERCMGVRDALMKMHDEATSENPPLFIEGIVFNRSIAVVITGRLAKRPIGKLRRLHRWSEWFYQHALKASQAESVPIVDYLFRHDQGAFWMGRYAFDRHVMLGKIRKKLPDGYLPQAIDPRGWQRFLGGNALSSKKLYEMLHRVPEETVANTFVIQDFGLPYTRAQEFIEEVQEKTQIYPLWLCPLKASSRPKILSPSYLPNHTDQIHLNIGVYGIPKYAGGAIAATIDLEQSVLEMGGRKGFYTHTYYSAQDLEAMFDMDTYRRLRQAYGADRAFLPLEAKVLNRG